MAEHSCSGGKCANLDPQVLVDTDPGRNCKYVYNRGCQIADNLCMYIKSKESNSLQLFFWCD